MAVLRSGVVRVADMVVSFLTVSGQANNAGAVGEDGGQSAATARRD
jgi:hypothetical protein